MGVISCIWTMQGVVLFDLTVLIPNVMGVFLGAAQLILYGMYCGNTPKKIIWKRQLGRQLGRSDPRCLSQKRRCLINLLIASDSKHLTAVREGAEPAPSSSGFVLSVQFSELVTILHGLVRRFSAAQNFLCSSVQIFGSEQTSLIFLSSTGLKQIVVE